MEQKATKGLPDKQRCVFPYLAKAAIKIKLGMKGNRINGNEANILVHVSILLNGSGVWS